MSMFANIWDKQIWCGCFQMFCPVWVPATAERTKQQQEKACCAGLLSCAFYSLNVTLSEKPQRGREESVRIKASRDPVWSTTFSITNKTCLGLSALLSFTRKKQKENFVESIIFLVFVFLFFDKCCLEAYILQERLQTLTGAVMPIQEVNYLSLRSSYIYFTLHWVTSSYIYTVFRLHLALWRKPVLLMWSSMITSLTPL